MKRKAVAAIVVILLAGSAILFLSTYPGSVGEKDGRMLLYGNVEILEVDAGFKSPGRIEELLTDEGKRVTAGDLMARLENAELAHMVDQNRAGLEALKQRLAELVAGSRPQEVRLAGAEVARARTELDNAGKELARAKALFKDAEISAQAMDNAQKGYDIALSLYGKAMQAKSLVDEGPRREAIAAMENSVKQAEALLKASEERLKDAFLYSPISGVVMKRHMEAGEVAAAGMPLFTIGDLSAPWVRVYVKETRIGRVKPGQRAEVTTDSFPGKIYRGTVSWISSEAEFTPKNIQTAEERVKLVFAVKVSVEDGNMELKPGMPAEVRLITDGG